MSLLQRLQRILFGFQREVSSKFLLRKFIKVMIFLVCLVGFVYQTNLFLSVYWAYPTVVDVSITNPNILDLPAVTVCSASGVRASKYCEKYPKMCTPIGNFESFCSYNFQCDKTKGQPREKMPVKRPSGWNMTRKEARELGHDPYFLISGYKTTDTDIRGFDPNARQWVGVDDVAYLPNTCYALNSLWGNVTEKPTRVIRRTTLMFTTTSEQRDNFYTYIGPTFQIAVHNPRSLVNAFSEGFAVTGGFIYYVYITEVKKQLLPAPFLTNCTDYETEWIANGGKGPLTSLQCSDECLKKIRKNQFGCFSSGLLSYDKNERYCWIHPKDLTSDDEDFIHCSRQCSAACNSVEYTVEVEQHGKLQDKPEPNLEQEISADIRISFNRMEVISYTHIPKYESIELFSYVGGYLGMWLGVSLVTACDLIETVIVLFRSRNRRYTEGHKRKEKLPLNQPLNQRNTIRPRNQAAWQHY